MFLKLCIIIINCLAVLFSFPVYFFVCLLSAFLSFLSYELIRFYRQLILDKTKKMLNKKFKYKNITFESLNISTYDNNNKLNNEISIDFFSFGTYCAFVFVFLG